MLKDVYKTTVYRLSHWRNQHHPAGALGPAGRVIPGRIITKVPSAELKPGQTDQDTLPPYDGSERYSVATASISYRRQDISRPILPGQPEAFVSRKGIQLGMARGDVEALIGEPDEVIGATSVYELAGESAILRRFNMPVYRATYAYEDDRLIGFQFGFPYP